MQKNSLKCHLSLKKEGGILPVELVDWPDGWFMATTTLSCIQGHNIREAWVSEWGTIIKHYELSGRSVTPHRFGRHQDREDGALSSQVSQEQPTQLNRQQGGLRAREGLQDHVDPCGRTATCWVSATDYASRLTVCSRNPLHFLF